MQLCQLDDMIFKEQKKPQHHLTIASNGFHFISNICSELYKKYQSEGIKLESREAFGIEALNLVSNQIAEIGIIRQWSCYKNLYSSQCRALNLEYYPITRLNIAVTVGTGSPLFYRKESSISRDMLKPYPMVMYDYMAVSYTHLLPLLNFPPGIPVSAPESPPENKDLQMSHPERILYALPLFSGS